jgi:hypothetical protein
MTETGTGPFELYAGAHGKVMAVRLTDGSLPALDFLNSIDPRAQATFRTLFQRQFAMGVLLSKERFRFLDHETPQVAEWKVHSPRALRLFGIRQGSTWYATHGSVKPGERGVKREVKRARTIFGEGSDDELV